MRASPSDDRMHFYIYSNSPINDIVTQLLPVTKSKSSIIVEQLHPLCIADIYASPCASPISASMFMNDSKKSPNKFHNIFANLWLGEYLSYTKLHYHGFTHILSIIDTEPDYIHVNNIYNFVYKWVNIQDTCDQHIDAHFEDCNEFIYDALRDKSNKVYVHCKKGISRSPCIIIAYIMKYGIGDGDDDNGGGDSNKIWSFDDAYNYVIGKRNTVSPNFAFIESLIHYEDFLRDAKAERYSLSEKSVRSNASM